MKKFICVFLVLCALLIFSGCSEADKVNRNLRIYPKTVLREACLSAIEAAKQSGQPVFGELEHASDPKVHLERIAVTFPELTWNEEAGRYNSVTRKFTKTTEEEIDDDYIDRINSIVNNRFSMSALILDNNYYKKVGLK